MSGAADDDVAAPPPGGPDRPRRSRAIAALMGFFIPGLGHAYLGRARRGLAWAAAPVLVTAAMIAAAPELGARVLSLFAAAAVVMWFGAIGDALVVDPAPERYPSGMRVALTAVVLLLASRANAALLRSSVLEAFKVPSGAMMPTLRVGDHLFADKAVYRKRAPRRGEIALFWSPEKADEAFVKRVVGVGGDRIEIKAGRLVVNGWEVPRCEAGAWRYDDEGGPHEGPLFVEFLEDAAYLVFHDEKGATEAPGPWDVAEGEVFFMGDNRASSHDSRMWFGGRGGGVARDKVLGRASVVWLSEAESGRIGVDLASLSMPAGAQHGLIEACLAKRPPREQATPPARAR